MIGRKKKFRFKKKRSALHEQVIVLGSWYFSLWMLVAALAIVVEHHNAEPIHFDSEHVHILNRDDR